MRISERSSDVSYTDLGAPKVKYKGKSKDNSPRSVGAASAAPTRRRVRVSLGRRNVQSRVVKTATSSPCSALRRRSRAPCHHSSFPDPARSEEHTSELQSLMRISYAVFCLKKKKHKTSNNQIPISNTNKTPKQHENKI